MCGIKRRVYILQMVLMSESEWGRWKEMAREHRSENLELREHNKDSTGHILNSVFRWNVWIFRSAVCVSFLGLRGRW